MSIQNNCKRNTIEFNAWANKNNCIGNAREKNAQAKKLLHPKCKRTKMLTQTNILALESNGVIVQSTKI